MHPFRADLHCHSQCSDGTLSPEDLVRHAVEIGLQGLSITDHDTINAYDRIIPLVNELGLQLLSGVEFSCFHKNNSIHILAYGFPLDSVLIRDFCSRHHQRRQARNLAMLKRLKDHHMPLSEEEVLSSAEGSVGRPHIAQAMVLKGYVGTISEAFQRFLGEGKPCYEAGTTFSVEETLEIIHRSAGLAVIAHPHLIPNQNILRDLLMMDFDGLECYYAKFPEADHKRWVKMAQRKGLLITGGSDFHGSIKPNNPLGCSFVDEIAFKKLCSSAGAKA
jgi:hypothetical protein